MVSLTIVIWQDVSPFVLLRREEFETLATTVGFKALALYGDYSSTPFQDEASPYMIWVLGMVQMNLTVPTNRRSSPVMLSVAKHLAADRDRPFASLRVT